MCLLFYLAVAAKREHLVLELRFLDLFWLFDVCFVCSVLAIYLFFIVKYVVDNICGCMFAATNLFKMLLKYRPEDKAAKKERLLKRAQAENEGKTVEAKKPIVVKYGLNHVTYLIEQVRHCFSVLLDYLLIEGNTFMATSIDNVDLNLFFSRTRPSLLSSLMMWIRLSLLCGFQPCAGRWRFLTALLKERLALDRYVLYTVN